MREFKIDHQLRNMKTWHKISLIDVMFHWGVTHEQFKFVKQLVRFTPNLDQIDSWGKTALMVAAN